LKEWFYKWHRKRVTGRCLIELKTMNKEFIKIITSDIFVPKGENLVKAIIDRIKRTAGDKLI